MLLLDSPQIFWDGRAADGNQIEAIFRRYGSPLVGQGNLMARRKRDPERGSPRAGTEDGDFHTPQSWLTLMNPTAPSG